MKLLAQSFDCLDLGVPSAYLREREAALVYLRVSALIVGRRVAGHVFNLVGETRNTYEAVVHSRSSISITRGRIF